MEELSLKAQNNANTLISLLKDRLRSNSKTHRQDQYGNVVNIDSDIYSNEALLSFICLSISEFNQTPLFTFFTLEDSKFVSCFSEILVEGATLYALSSQALIEKGREFMIKDDGIHFDPPALSDLLNTQYVTLLTHHWEKLKHIKECIEDFDQ